MDVIWKIKQLDRNPNTGLVLVAYWTADIVDGEYNGHAYGAVGFDQGDSFIPFKDLTENDVLDWVKEKIDWQTIENGLKNNIEHQKNKPLANGIPWGAK
jgi:hypothetical protein